MSVTAIVVLIVSALTLLGVWAVCAVLYQLLRQQGRVLLRLEAIEQRAGLAPPPAVPKGLAPGTAFPEFTLNDLDGTPVSLQQYRGKRVLLVNWSAHCMPCRTVAPQLAKLEPDLRRRNVELLFISSGDREENQVLAHECSLRCPILLVPESQKGIQGFERLGTPVAYLLDPQGNVAHSLAEGVTDVVNLAREVAKGRHTRAVAADAPPETPPAGRRPLSESRIERNGIAAGTPAPNFRLPDLYGHTVSLGDFRGRNVLLVFSDPHCGPCQALAGDLAAFHQRHGGRDLAILMVSRGDLDENIQKARQHGIEFPVLLQQQWKLSREYGIFATPVAFLIGEDGLIARDVAQGPERIMSLARQAISGRTYLLAEETHEQAQLV